MADISRIKIGSVVYELKDAVARKGGLVFHLATNAANTPQGVTWDDEGTPVTGTLTAWDGTQPRTGIYLVKSLNGTGDTYDEYVAVSTADPATQATTSWEKLGDTEIDISEIASRLKATVTKTTDKVLGESTTFTNAASSVTFSGGTSDTFVKSYPGTSSKLETATITGCGDNVTFNAVNANTSVTATNTVFGTDTTASKIVTETKEATKLVLGTATTASKATAGTAVSVAKVASSATAVSYIGNANTTSVLESATYDSATETLEIASVNVQQGSVTGTNGTQSITPYTFADVTVPVVTSNTAVSIASVKTNTDVAVPVVSSNTEVTATNTTTVSKTAATKASAATTVATGSLKANDTVGATVMTGLGTATTANAVTGIGTGTAGAQTITVGTNDKVDAVTNVTVAIEPNTGA